MNVTEQQTEFLGWKMIPVRLDATRTAWFLGFDPHEVPVLVGSGLLKPLGHPARNSTKFFATETLEQFRRDEKWLARVRELRRWTQQQFARKLRKAGHDVSWDIVARWELCQTPITNTRLLGIATVLRVSIWR